MSVCFRPASGLPLDELAALFTASFQEYLVPMSVDARALQRMIDLYDLDLDASRVAAREGRSIGLVNLGVRDRAGWIGGMGVVPDERGAGVGALLMQEIHTVARTRGLAELWLEVIDANAPARALYTKLGYEPTRDLDVWVFESLTDAAASTTARSVPAAEAHDRLRRFRQTREPWQRADQTVERLLRDDEVHGLVTDGGAAIVRVGERGGTIDQIAALDAASAADLLAAALHIAHPLHLVNLPVSLGWTALLSSMGGSVSVRQHELRLKL